MTSRSGAPATTFRSMANDGADSITGGDGDVPPLAAPATTPFWAMPAPTGFMAI